MAWAWAAEMMCRVLGVLLDGGDVLLVLGVFVVFCAAEKGKRRGRRRVMFGCIFFAGFSVAFLLAIFAAI